MHSFYDLFLQIAVNQMIANLREKKALVLIDLSPAYPPLPPTICLDDSTVTDLMFSQTGFQVELSLDGMRAARSMQFEVPYHSISQIVCYYEQMETQHILYRKTTGHSTPQA